MKRTLVSLLLLCFLVSGAFAQTTVSEPGVYPITDEKTELTIWTGLPGNLENYETNFQTLWYEDFSNVHVNWEVANASELQNKLNISIASGDYPDIYFDSASATLLLDYAEDGIVIPLNDLIDEQGYYIRQVLEKYPDVLAQITAPDGNIYSLFNISYNPFANLNKMYVNKNWLAQYQAATGNDTPDTPAAFEEMLLYFKENDMNGNGDPNDEIPLTGTYQYWTEGSDPLFYFMDAFILTPTSPVKFVMADENENLTFTANTDAYREGLKFVNGLYEKGLLYDGTYVQDLTQFRALTTVPREQVVVGACTGMSPGRILSLTGKEDYVNFSDYVMMLPLKNSEGVRQTWNVDPNKVILKNYITTAAENPEVAIKWLDYWYSQEGAQWINFSGLEGTHWTWKDVPSVGGADRSVSSLLVDVPFAQNFYWTDWSVNQISDESTFTSMALADAAVISKLASYLEQQTLLQYSTMTCFPFIVWCEDEEITITLDELKTLISKYCIESSTKFVTGLLDVDDDAVWNSYLKELDNMGLDTYMEMLSEYYFGN